MNLKIDIPDDLCPLFDILGEEKALEVVMTYQGTTIYFSKSILKQFEREQMKKEYNNGTPFKELAKKYGYSINYLRRICKKNA